MILELAIFVVGVSVGSVITAVITHWNAEATLPTTVAQAKAAASNVIPLGK